MSNLSVDKAIQKGHQMVNYPIFAIMLIGFGLTLYLNAFLNREWIFPIGFILTFALMWLWWSFIIVKWRIWAFENCRNVHELKRRAINEKLIWPDKSIFEKTEIINFEQRNKLELLKTKFNLPDVPEYINDDGSIPDETKIYYSKISIAIYWISGIGLFSWGIYLLTKGDVLGYFIVLVSIFSFYYANKKSSIKKAHIILNSKGIKTLNTSFMKWEDVVLIESRLNGSGKNSKWHLIVDFNKNDSDGNWGDDLEISDLNMSTKKIDQLIKLYQQRNKNNNIAIN